VSCRRNRHPSDHAPSKASVRGALPQTTQRDLRKRPPRLGGSGFIRVFGQALCEESFPMPALDYRLSALLNFDGHEVFAGFQWS
jgi:hypothetical protein